MGMIDEFAARADHCLGTNLDTVADIEFAVVADKHMFADDYRWAWRPYAVIVEIDVVFENAPRAYCHLMWPGYVQPAQ